MDRLTCDRCGSGLLLDAPVRLQATCDGAGMYAVAGTNPARDAMAVLIGSGKGNRERVALTLSHVPWEGRTSFEVLLVDAEHNLDVASSGALPAGTARLDVPLRKPSVALVKLRKG